jgi:hypothetical protein
LTKIIEEATPENPVSDPIHKKIVELLLMAGLCYQITHSSANGIPLGANINPKYRRIIPFDTGIRTSLENFGTYQNIKVYPLYAIGNIL